jgi:hypothetical protein
VQRASTASGPPFTASSQPGSAWWKVAISWSAGSKASSRNSGALASRSAR